MPLLANHQTANSIKHAVRAYGTCPVSETKINWELVKQHLPLLKSLVSRMRVYFPDQVESEELYSLGMSGLIHAALRFDASRSTSFGAYAAHRIRGALLDELRKMDWLPRSERIVVKELKTKIALLEQKLGRAPTEIEAADFLNISVSEYYRRLDQARPLAFISIHQEGSDQDQDEVLLYESLADASILDTRDACEKNEHLSVLKKRIEAMDEMPRTVLMLYYYKGLRLSEIAELLKVSESRVCQIHTQAVLSLKGYFQRISNQSS